MPPAIRELLLQRGDLVPAEGRDPFDQMTYVMRDPALGALLLSAAAGKVAARQTDQLVLPVPSADA